MVLLKRIKNAFNINLTLKEFFELPNIKAIAICIDEMTLLLQGSKDSTTRKTIVI
jgi:hypothetical protein